MDFRSIGQGILTAFAVMAGIAGALGALYLILYVVTIMLGSIFQVAESGNLPITSGANTTLGTLETGYNTAVTSVNTGATFGANLIPVAVVMLVFGGVVGGAYLGYKAYKKMKGKDSSNY